jgi:F-type H+-transporting ATPase subunit gamma
MSRRRQIEDRVRSLGDIREILGAMKSLALMELQKLARLRATQREWTSWLEAAGSDLTSFYPDLRVAPQQSVFVALGSEHGFCGDFNERVAAALCARMAVSDAAPGSIVAVGRRLWPLVEHLMPVPVQVEGASVAEEIETVLARLVRAVDECNATQLRSSRYSVSIVHHDLRFDAATSVELTPFRRGLEPVKRRAYAALVNEPPAALLTGVAKEYLFAMMSAILCESLATESDRRLRHMDDALRRLDERVAALDLKRRGLRREEITEEIEVILLSAGSVSGRVRETRTAPSDRREGGDRDARGAGGVRRNDVPGSSNALGLRM